MTAEQKRLLAGFAAGLGKLKANEELGQPAELTPDEVAGIVWGIKQLRGGSDHGPADHAADR